MKYDDLFRDCKVALQFSGGKDSLVLLSLLQPYWDRLTVYYCNSGDSFPETDRLIAAVKAIVPHFVEVQGRRPLVERHFGWPSDLLTPSSTDFGQMVGETGPTLTDRYTCCSLSIMQPMHERMKADGIEVILRGQRNSDRLKSPVVNGQAIDGFSIIYPIADFSEQQVFDYLVDNCIEIPPFYAEGMTSGGDCLHCTAWLEHGQHKYVAKHHPQAAAVVFQRLEEIKRAADDKYKRLLQALGEKQHVV